MDIMGENAAAEATRAAKATVRIVVVCVGRLRVSADFMEPESTLGAKSNKRCDRLKYQIKFIVQINPIVFTAKSTVLGIRFLSNQSQEFLYGSHLYRGWALPLKRWDLCWT